MYDFILSEQLDYAKARVRMERRRSRRRHRSLKRMAEQRIEALEKDVGFLALTLSALIERLDASGSVTREDVRTMVDALDDFDGVKDGQLDVTMLRALTYRDAPVEEIPGAGDDTPD